MTKLKPLDQRLGVCGWSLRPRDPADLVRRMQAAELNRVQLALAPLCEDPATWDAVPQTLADAGIDIASGMLATVGEDYSSIAAIHRTGGIVPDDTWPASRQLALKVIDKAVQLRLALITFHVGFIPEDAADVTYAKVRDRLRELADFAGERDVALGLETGQESAAALDAFLADLDRDNVGVNFDPANMLLYGSGDPIEAVTLLMPRLRQVHIKDATPSATPGEWGAEVVVGTGAVDWTAFAAALRQGGFDGDLMIEREAGDSRIDDIAIARAFALRVFQ
jgi:sugar phosphate isomerase/epimerase